MANEEQKKILSKNIKRYMNKNDVNVEKLSKDLKIPDSTINNWLTGQNYPRIDKIQMLADYFNIYKSDLQEDRPSNVIEIKKIKNIPVISEVACGDPIFAEDNFEKTIPYSMDLLPSGNCFFVQAKGDSMDPTIKNKELVLMREQGAVENGEVACVVFNSSDSEATLKRVKKQGGEVYLVPDNPDYLPYKLNEDDDVRILGKAMFVINQL